MYYFDRCFADKSLAESYSSRLVHKENLKVEIENPCNCYTHAMLATLVDNTTLAKLNTPEGVSIYELCLSGIPSNAFWCEEPYMPYEGI